MSGRRLLALALAALFFLPALCGRARADGVADASQMAAVEEITEPGMIPVSAAELVEGEYPVAFKCSSSMFRVDAALLKVAQGRMEVTLTMGSKSFLYVYPGSAAEADAAPEDSRIAPVPLEDGTLTFTLPVAALDAPVPCAAYSKNRELWYDRSLLFRADSLPVSAFREGFFTTARSLGLADGDYTAAVTLTGGSGRAKLESPARLTVRDGQCTAELVWGSRNYDYMRIGETRYLPVGGEGGARFVIPVAYFDRGLAVVADTVAMSEPHEIAYTLFFDSASLEAAG